MGATVNDVKNVVGKMCDIIIENEVYFCDLDAAAGDGDFGMSLAKGFRELKKQMPDLDASSVDAFLRECSMVIMEHCGGASGPIWGSAFRFAANSAKGKDVIETADVAEMFEAAVAGIQKRGGASLGDKTLLDALIPAAEALKKAAGEGKDMKEAFGAAAKAAEQGAENTKGIVAKKGRATYVGERSIGHPDAGAVAVSVLFNSFV